MEWFLFGFITGCALIGAVFYGLYPWPDPKPDFWHEHMAEFDVPKRPSPDAPRAVTRVRDHERTIVL